MPRLLIVYNSTTGNTKAMAEAIAEGARSLKLDTDVVDAFNVTPDEVMAADAVGFGVPTFNYHAARPILKLLDDLAGKDIKGKLAIVFGSYGWSGQGAPVVAERLRQMGFRVLDPVIRVKLKPSDNELEGCQLLGKDVAMHLKNIKMTENLNA
ncbi:MAG TPA: flavodoxin domain-containing protein [Methanocella sp.]|uniref:flavodoxin domain-containing protein n=1 Tax=Methanocella sp. TaxID=2052833 RepID=UPI002B58A1D6|nr:flavodoxin domain-containing protein [Methanocella sp.]HTY90814.1 flavodoxin domain-containing protein [Methanocella sp.]